MIFDLILAVIALAMLWTFLQMLFWIVAYLALQPVRWGLMLVSGIMSITKTYQERPTAQATGLSSRPSNVIPFRRSNARG